MQNLMKFFFVVCHIKTWEQALAEADKVLIPNGAHGIIFICHNGAITSGDDYPNIFDLAEEAKRLHPDYLVGVNCLDLSNLSALEKIKKYPTIDILWTDKGGINESPTRAFIDPELEEALKTAQVQYFGSEWFKYQTPPLNPELVIKEAAKHFDAILTSGNETGSPPPVAKIEAIRKWIGPEHKLGNASGIGADNIDAYLPYINYFLIATKICIGDGKLDNFYYADIEKVKEVRSKIDAYCEKNS